MRKTVDVELTAREVDLLLAYAFAFDNELEQLERFAGKPGYHVLKTTEFYLIGLIADLVRSAREIEDDGLLYDIDRVCTIMETAKMRC